MQLKLSAHNYSPTIHVQFLGVTKQQKSLIIDKLDSPLLKIATIFKEFPIIALMD